MAQDKRELIFSNGHFTACAGILAGAAARCSPCCASSFLHREVGCVEAGDLWFRLPVADSTAVWLREEINELSKPVNIPSRQDYEEDPALHVGMGHSSKMDRAIHLAFPCFTFSFATCCTAFSEIHLLD